MAGRQGSFWFTIGIVLSIPSKDLIYLENLRNFSFHLCHISHRGHAVFYANWNDAFVDSEWEKDYRDVILVGRGGWVAATPEARKEGWVSVRNGDLESTEFVASAQLKLCRTR